MISFQYTKPESFSYGCLHRQGFCQHLIYTPFYLGHHYFFRSLDDFTGSFAPQQFSYTTVVYTPGYTGRHTFHFPTMKGGL